MSKCLKDPYEDGDAVQTRLANAQHKIRELERALHVAERYRKTALTAANNRYQEHDQQLQDAYKAIDALRAEMKAQVERNNTLYNNYQIASTTIISLQSRNAALTEENEALKKRSAPLQSGQLQPTLSNGTAQPQRSGSSQATLQASKPPTNVADDVATAKKVMQEWQNKFDKSNDPSLVLQDMVFELGSRERRQRELGVRHRRVSDDERKKEKALEQNVQYWRSQAHECIEKGCPVTLTLTR